MYTKSSFAFRNAECLWIYIQHSCSRPDPCSIDCLLPCCTNPTLIPLFSPQSCHLTYKKKAGTQWTSVTVDSGSTISDSNLESESFTMNNEMEVIDPESQVELEEKTRLINQVLELQHTLEELSARVDAVKEENLKLKSENQVLGQYIENLMSASSVFQTTDTKGKRK
ncbi:short coiled-coil protein isoform X2 [Narcine bancroftii]|uniref:short coiled-coil protein isoform X2 n=1 Tax=Narcine bancroftii TaxID=1343680 RepID=UPI003831BBCE